MAEPENSDVARFLTFRANGGLYALPASEVVEIIAVPPLTKLPVAPKALLGMGNLRGSVIAVASLRALMGDAAEMSPASRAIVLDGISPIAVTVDAVERLGALDAGRTGEPAATVLDMKTLLARAFVPRAKPAGATSMPIGQRKQGVVRRQSETKALVTFEVAGQAYALELAEVREIIALPAVLAAVPQAEALILGLTAYRDCLLPLLSLRGLLGFPLEHDARNKVLVTSVGGVMVGLVADRMREIIHADPQTIEPAPPLLVARAGGETKIDSIYRGGNGRLISLLATQKLFGDEVMARLGNHSKIQTEISVGPKVEKLQFLVFGLGAQEFALPISAVRQVAAVPEKITRLPKTPKFLAGVVNLRGEVLPVIDQRSRFDLPKLGSGGGRQRLIVMRSARHQAGLIVDGISEILSAAADAIEPAPHLAGEEGRLVRGVLNLEAAGRLILLLDPDELLTQTERSLLDVFNAASVQPAVKTGAGGKERSAAGP